LLEDRAETLEVLGHRTPHRADHQRRADLGEAGRLAAVA
jgi:hypothetical protein